MADIVTNPKARRDYHVLETFEAGLALKGTEVKSVRAGKVQIADAFARIEKDEAWLYNAHIDEFTFGVANRGASIRIPHSFVANGFRGYLEDRRPNSLGDPYRIAGRILQTIATVDVGLAVDEAFAA